MKKSVLGMILAGIMAVSVTGMRRQCRKGR